MYSSGSGLQHCNGQEREGHRAELEHLLGQPARDIFVCEQNFCRKLQHESYLKQFLIKQ